MRRPLPEPLAILGQSLSTVFERFPVIAAVYLFGSMARGTARSDSDVDLGVVLRDRGMSAASRYREIGDLIARLEPIVAPRAADVVVLEDQGPMFCHRVLLGGKLIFESDRERRVDFESDVIALALDFAPTYELATKGREAGLLRWLERRRS